MSKSDLGTLIVVTDEDVNIFDDAEVEWAVATRFQAGKGLMRVLSKEGTNLGIDATVPLGERGDTWKRC